MSKRDKYNTGAHSVYLCQYHLVWCPKFRFKVLKNEVEVELKQIFRDISAEYDYEIIEMEVMPDHVHLFVGAKPSVAPSDIVRTLKSISAIKLFAKFKPLKDYYSRCGVLWSRGKFISTIGFVSAETIKKYIQEQKDWDENVEGV
jgi:putative transposase